jgi:hypothetical protein
MDGTAKLLEQIRKAARRAADIDLMDASWDAAGLRDLVIDLLERGGRTLVAIGGPDAQTWNSMTWSDSDSPVVLARALGLAHRRLSAAVRERPTHGLDRASTGGPHTKTIESPPWIDTVTTSAPTRSDRSRV